MITKIRQYNSPREAIEDFKKRGFTYDFNEDTRGLCKTEHEGNFPVEEFKIVESYRFETVTDPDDSEIVYTIESQKYKTKGFMINAFGIYSDAHTNDFARKVEIVREHV